MKKIIYSLVIMIAAGSLFTSCVNYDEPVGVQDLREAKASYLDALSGLRAADAEVQKSIAALYNAQAEMEKANAAYRNAEVEYQKLVNDSLATQNAQQKANAEKAIAQAKADAEKAAVNNAEALAKAKEQLEKELKRIEADALSLTQDEKNAINSAVTYLTAALANYNTAVGNVESAKSNLFKVQNGIAVAGITGINDELTAEAYKAAQNDSIADAKAEIAKLNERKEALSSNPDVQAWTAYVDGLKAEVAQNSYDSAKAVAAAAVLEQSLIKDAVTAAAAELAAWKEENKVTLQYSPVEIYWPVPAWATQTNGTYAQKFINVMNSWLDYLDQSTNILNSITASDGKTYIQMFGVDDDVNKILNGNETGATHVEKLGLKGIISVIEDNELLNSDSTQVKNASTKATKAAAAYAADLDTLKKGLVAYMALDTNYTKAVADTVLAIDSLKLEIDTLHTAIAAYNTAYTADTAAKNALVKAINDLGTVVVNFKARLASGATYTDQNADTLLTSIQSFITAKQALLGASAQDSIVYVKQVNGSLGINYQPVKEAILDLELEDFTQTIESIGTSGSNRTFNASNKFTKYTYSNDGTQVNTNSYVLEYQPTKNDNGTTWADVQTIYPSAVYSIPLSSGYGPFDIVLQKYFPDFAWGSSKAYRQIALTNARFDGFVKYDSTWGFVVCSDNTYSTYSGVFNSAALKLADAAKTAATTDSIAYAQKVTAVKDALYAPMAKDIDNFAKVYNRFFGLTANAAESNWHNGNWSAAYIKANPTVYKTYFPKDEPKDLAKEIADAEYFAELVKGYLIEDPLGEICSEVAVVIAQAMNKFNYSGNADAIIAKYNKGEFKTMVDTQIASDLAEAWEESEDILTTLKGWVADAEKAMEEAKENNEEFYAALDELYEKERGINTKLSELVGRTIYYNSYTFDVTTALSIDANGVYKAPEAGQQKVIYDKYLKVLVAQYAEAQKAITNASNRNTAIATLLTTAEPAAAAALAVYNQEVGAATTFAAAYKNVVDAIDNLINAQNTKIDTAEWLLAQIEAGVDAKTLAIASAERALKVAEQALADAEVAMKLAQAQYDAVMAKYVK